MYRHPVWKIPGYDKWCIPLRTHGDGGEILNNEPMMVLTFTGLLARGSTKELSMLMTAWPYHITAKKTP